MNMLDLQVIEALNRINGSAVHLSGRATRALLAELDEPRPPYEKFAKHLNSMETRGLITRRKNATACFEIRVRDVPALERELQRLRLENARLRAALRRDTTETFAELLHERAAGELARLLSDEVA